MPNSLLALASAFVVCSTSAFGQIAPPGSATQRSLQPAAPGAKIAPLRIAAIGRDLKLKGPWLDYPGGLAQACGQELNFDCFEPPGTNYTPCKSGQNPWFFGLGFQNMFVTNDMTVERGTEGLTSDRILVAWHWFVNGSGTSEQCFIAVFTAEDFDDTCAGPAAANFYDGVIMDFGILPSGNGSYWVDAELCNVGLLLQNPLDGSGAYEITFAKDYDPANGQLTLATSAQPMLWGVKPEAPGSQGPIQWDDTDPPDHRYTAPDECHDYSNPNRCPDPLGAMFAMYTATGGPPPCGGLLCGDTNCDGRFDGADIDAFFFALGDPGTWVRRYPLCDLLCAADINGDARVNGGDIDPFFRALGGNGPCDSGGG